MHLNEGKNNIHSEYLHVTSFGVKSQISKYVVWLITFDNKTSRNLKFTGLVCLTRHLHCTNYKRSMSRDSGSMVKKLIKFAKIVQSKAFESLMLET